MMPEENTMLPMRTPMGMGALPCDTPGTSRTCRRFVVATATMLFLGACAARALFHSFGTALRLFLGACAARALFRSFGTALRAEGLRPFTPVDGRCATCGLHGLSGAGCGFRSDPFPIDCQDHQVTGPSCPTVAPWPCQRCSHIAKRESAD